jgi:hypothetical protein
MKIIEDSVTLNLALVIVILSLISSILGAIVHHLIPKIRRNPGQLVLINCYIHIVADCNWVLLLTTRAAYFNVLTCDILGIVATAYFNASNFYLLFFCLEVYILVSKKIVTPHTKRIRIYHFVSIATTLAIVLAAMFAEGFAIHNDLYCLITPGSLIEKIFYAIVSICLIVIWILIVLSLKKLNKSDSNLTRRYLLIILLTTVFITISFTLGLIAFFSSGRIRTEPLSMPFIASVGLTLGIGRLYNRALMREIMIKACKRKVMIKKDAHSIQLKWTKVDVFANESLINIDEEPISLNQYFETESVKHLLRIFTCLSLRFSTSVNNLEAYNNYNEYYFEEEHFLNALGSLSIDTFHDSIVYLVYDPNLTIKDIKSNIFKNIRDAFDITDESLSG